MINTKLIKKSGLNTLNAWKIQIGSEKFIVTPAHNIIYKPDKTKNVFKSSPFVPSGYNSGWFVPTKYVNSEQYDLLNDLAWKPICKKNSQTIKSVYIDPEQIYYVKYFYYQPYDFDGIKVSKQNYSLGCNQTIIYKCPSNNISNISNIKDEYFEAINMGFRGMSGTIITNQKANKFVGLFVRRIGNLGTNPSDSTIQTEMVGVSRGFVIPTKQIENIIYLSDSVQISSLI
jgi:hypothetical protein